MAAQNKGVTNRLVDKIWNIFDPRSPLGHQQVSSAESVDEQEWQRLRSLGYIR